MKNTIKFAVVGCGRIGMRHVETVLNHGKAQLVATVDPAGRKELNGHDLSEVPHFASLEDFVAAGIEADIVNIATPNGWHAQQAVALLAAATSW